MNKGNHKLSSNTEAMKILRDCINQGHTDREIQEILKNECNYKWDLSTIQRQRSKLGIKKTSHGRVVKSPNLELSILASPPYGISPIEKAEWFRDRFKENHLYLNLQRQLTDDEVGVYLEDYGNLCCQFEDIVISEFFQIDDFLKHRLLIDRQLVLAKLVNEEIANLQQWLIDNPKQDGETDKEQKARYERQSQLNDKYKLLKNINDRYDALARERQRIYDGLAATRKDRLDELKGGKQTFLSLVNSLQNSRPERDKHGKYAELTKLATIDITDALRKKTEFPDGTYSPIIMDSDTNFDE